MTAPIRDFINDYCSENMLRCHMPGHKGRAEQGDITEIKGADSLFEAEGIIKESEKNASEIFGSYKTLYSAGGSTLCIQTMITVCMGVTGSKRIIAARNCHRAFLSACVLTGAEPEWIFPHYEYSLVSGKISPSDIEKALSVGEKPACVYITSPDYYGSIACIDEISRICKRHGVFLAVDNAHGAYLRFIKDERGIPLHPLFHGADICCDSAHKTLPVLTGGAYLHIAAPSLEKYEGYAKEIMSLYGSSSPSYLILRSLDECNLFMSEKGEEYFSALNKMHEKLTAELSPPFRFLGNEPGKLTIFAPSAGYTGRELAEVLRSHGAECEYADEACTVLMLTGLTAEEISSLEEILKSIPMRRMRVDIPNISGFAPPQKVMSLREASFAPSECVDIDNAAGRICARAVSCCPPGVAVVVGGEIFSENNIKILKNYSIFKVNVVK